MSTLRFVRSGIQTVPAMVLLLVGSLLVLLVLLGLAALIAVVGLVDAPHLTSRRANPAALRDPQTPVIAGIRHLAQTRRGSGADVLEKIYEERAYRPFWVTPHSLSGSGRGLLLHFASPGREQWRGDEHLLTEIGHLYRLAFPDTTPENPHAIADLEWALSTAFLTYAKALVEGRVPWARAEEDWHVPERPSDIVRIFAKLDEWGAPQTLEYLLRSHEPYTSLRRALLEYRSIERAGGWPRIEAEDLLQLGDRSERVQELRRRLRVTRDLEAPGDSPAFDAELERAVRRFQERHGLKGDGHVGIETLEALNVSVADRIRQLEVNLERRRWLPPTLGEEFLWINVPEFRLRAFRGQRETLGMAVVVGAPDSPTPSFREPMDYAVLNPYWNVPESIAVNELAPKAHQDPGYLVKANFEILDERGSTVAIADGLRTDLLRSGRLRLRRRPGPQNDLGRIKFIFPNRFGIYLHDTPARHLFARTSRAFSHGCIRVGQPLELARYLFPERFDELETELDAGEEKVLKLGEPVPVYIVYFTAWRNDDGTVHFRKDIYGRDETLKRRLAGGSSRERPDSVLTLVAPKETSSVE